MPQGYGSQVSTYQQPIKQEFSSSQVAPSPYTQTNYYNNNNGGGGGGQVMNQFGQLAVQGAQTFYQGFQQANRIFGIDTSQTQYEIPLVNSAATFFGRK